MLTYRLGVIPAYLVQTALKQGGLTGIGLERKAMINHIAVVQLANKIPTITKKASSGM